MNRCLILTPVASHIEPACEAALQELERRGYPVWRVRGYSAIDQARNQLATDAFLQGFAETLWIDSDIVFQPDDVDRLREHGLPICCGIYPKKGKRELAVHALPGTQEITFGRKGGLVEVRYAATGFLHIRREVYATMREKLALITCNERFGRPLIPFFQPMIVDNGEGPWYLAEDFSFCERARQCGYRIMADTRIRLSHVGSYQYSWEDAGAEQKRFGSYTYKVLKEAPTAKGTSASWLSLQKQFPPDDVANGSSVAPPRELSAKFRSLLKTSLNGEPSCILHLGPTDGAVLSFLAQQSPDAALIALHPTGDGRRITHDTHSFADRRLLLGILHSEGMKLLQDSGIMPNLIITADDPTYESLRSDIALAIEMFPQAMLLGGTWGMPGVKDALRDEIASRGWKVEVHGEAWRVKRNAVPKPAP